MNSIFEIRTLIYAVTPTRIIDATRYYAHKSKFLFGRVVVKVDGLEIHWDIPASNTSFNHADCQKAVDNVNLSFRLRNSFDTLFNHANCRTSNSKNSHSLLRYIAHTALFTTEHQIFNSSYIVIENIHSHT